MLEPARSDLRPQRFGPLNSRKVVDPLIEPIWVGERVLAHVEAVGPGVVDGQPFVAIQNEDGELLDAYRDVTRAWRGHPGDLARARRLPHRSGRSRARRALP